MWHLLHRRALSRWCLHKSTGRRWLPTDGSEWPLLSALGDPTAGFHVLRLLGGGLRGAAKRRPRDARLPGLCRGCGFPGTAVRWSTRTPEHE